MRLEEQLRELAPRVLGVVARRQPDIATAEDAVQEALIAAAAQWPVEGVPESPLGWLVRVALRRMADEFRSEAARRRREAEFAATVAESDGGDDSLALLQLCCHPALTPASAIALTLRAVGGLTTAEIARAFLVPEATMAQRISRAKENIRKAGGRFERPGGLETVRQVLYLMFNEGYVSGEGERLQRPDLAAEAIRLARMLPEDGDSAGLLALMLLTDARRAARTGPLGELIPLPEQDRTLWDRARIAEGLVLVERALRSGARSAYPVLAAVAALHDEAERAEDTDWPQIVALYEVLLARGENAVVELNYAAAVGMARGAEAGLAALEKVDGRLASHRVDAVRGHLLEMAGDGAGAAEAYGRAAMRTGNLQERNYLLLRAARLRGC